MTSNLKPRQLDVTVAKITAATVYYELAANGQAEEWRIPAESTFDKSQLVVGQRYRVTTRVIMSRVWDHKAQQYLFKERYDWSHVEVRAPKARVTATAKRSGPDLPLADGGDIFGW